MKKYSRLVRKLTHTLAYFNVPTVFREHVFSPTDVEGYEYKEVHLADIIERAVANETISKKEVDRLRAVAYQEGIWEKRYNAEKQWKNYYRDRLYEQATSAGHWRRQWIQSQEDRTWWVERATTLLIKLNDFKTKLWDAEQEVSDLKHEVFKLQDEIERTPEQIHPPACLSTLDALAYTNKTIFAEGQRILSEIGFFI